MENKDIPPDVGRRPEISPNGEVHGSGAGAGGSNPGEDYDSDESSGSGSAPEHGPRSIEDGKPAEDKHNETYG